MWRWNQQRGRKRFPLSHRKRKNEGEGRERERDCKGNESLLRLGKKLLQRGEGGKRGSEDTAAKGGGEKERVATILPRPRREGDL